MDGSSSGREWWMAVAMVGAVVDGSRLDGSSGGREWWWMGLAADGC